MQNAKIFRVMFSFIQNAEFIALMRLFWAFFGLLRPKSKMENNHLFAKVFAWCLVPLCKMMDQNPFFFEIEGN
jgi:hypothetical protein